MSVFAREGAAGGSRPASDNVGDGAEGELPGQTGAPALGEQRGETQEHFLKVIVVFPIIWRPFIR